MLMVSDGIRRWINSGMTPLKAAVWPGVNLTRFVTLKHVSGGKFADSFSRSFSSADYACLYESTWNIFAFKGRVKGITLTLQSFEMFFFLHSDVVKDITTNH